MPYFDELRSAFMGFHALMVRKDEIYGDVVDVIYEAHFNNPKFRTTRIKSKPHFDMAIYPSLFKTLTILPGGKPIDCDLLPELSDNLDEINAELSGNPLARLLLGFIWKQGDINTLQYVFQGVHGRPHLSDKGTVMYQFGRHLANPAEQPIFDQHTYRAYRLLAAIHDWPDRTLFCSLFQKSDGVQAGDTLPAGALGSYLKWWNTKVAARAPEGVDARLAAISAIDRLLFLLGKAAKLQINA
jgi:hypothetical protein